MVINFGRYPETLVESLKDSDEIDIVTTEKWGNNTAEGAQSIIDQKPAIFHVHWPEAIAHHLHKGPELFAAYQEFFKTIKANGIKIIWTQHNILPHRLRDDDFYKNLYQLFADNADGLIHHSAWGEKYFHNTYSSNAKNAIIRHGAFTDEATYKGTKEEARKELDIPNDKRVFLTIGSIRPDKNLDELINCFLQRSDKNELLIFSLSNNGLPEDINRLRSLAQKAKTVRILEGQLSSEALAINAKASDTFVFTYGDKNLTSGSPHLSQAHGIPQICLPSPYSEEVMGKSGLFFEPTPTIGDGLNQFLEELDQNKLEAYQKFFQETPEEYQWGNIAKKTVTFYHKILNNN